MFLSRGLGLPCSLRRKGDRRQGEATVTSTFLTVLLKGYEVGMQLQDCPTVVLKAGDLNLQVRLERYCEAGSGNSMNDTLPVGHLLFNSSSIFMHVMMTQHLSCILAVHWMLSY